MPDETSRRSEPLHPLDYSNPRSLLEPRRPFLWRRLGCLGAAVATVAFAALGFLWLRERALGMPEHSWSWEHRQEGSLIIYKFTHRVGVQVTGCAVSVCTDGPASSIDKTNPLVASGEDINGSWEAVQIRGTTVLKAWYGKKSLCSWQVGEPIELQQMTPGEIALATGPAWHNTPALQLARTLFPSLPATLPAPATRPVTRASSRPAADPSQTTP